MTEVLTDLLLLLVATNGAPVLAARIFRTHGDLPVDLGRLWSDGSPIFGSSKTWRGVAAALVTCCILSILLNYGFWFGLVFGALVMLGDLTSSFFKRRWGLDSSARALGLDQLPESLLPGLFAVLALGIPWWWAPLLALAFMVLELVISKPLFWLHIRKRPY